VGDCLLIPTTILRKRRSSGINIKQRQGPQAEDRASRVERESTTRRIQEGRGEEVNGVEKEATTPPQHERERERESNERDDRRVFFCGRAATSTLYHLTT
jgi:hypothetical protein